MSGLCAVGSILGPGVVPGAPRPLGDCVSKAAFEVVVGAEVLPVSKTHEVRQMAKDSKSPDDFYSNFKFESEKVNL